MEALSYLETLTHWDWLVVGLVLVILEIFAPGAVFIWMGLAAGVVGLIVFLFPDISWKWQFIGFAILAITTILLSRRFLKSRPLDTDHPDLNRRGSQYLGRSFVLDEAIIGGHGRMSVDDSSWRIEGPDLPSGAKVIVMAVDGATLQIKPADPA